MQLGTIARTQGQRGKTAQPSISHSGQGLEGKKSSSLPVEGGIFSLTFPFIDQAITLRTPAHQIAWDGIAIFQSYSVGQPGTLGTATRALCLRDSAANQSPTTAPAFRPACRAILACAQ